MTTYLLKDNNGHIYGYKRGYDNRAFDITNDVFITFNDKKWAEDVADALNMPQLNLALPVTVVEVKLMV